MILHNLTCNCTQKRSDLLFNKKLGKNGLMACPDHRDGHTISRFIICVDCGKKRMLKGLASGGKVDRCEKCQKIKAKKIVNSNSEKYRAAKPYRAGRKRYDNLADIDRRSSCMHTINTCGFFFQWFNNMPCKGCGNYKNDKFEIDPYETKLSYNERTRY